MKIPAVGINVAQKNFLPAESREKKIFGMTNTRRKIHEKRTM
jgi:hypothetical protein